MGNGRHSGLYHGYKKSTTAPKQSTSGNSRDIDWSAYRKLSIDDMLTMRTDLGQDDINDSIYVGTSDSFHINANLRQREGQQQSGWTRLSNERVDKLAARIDSWMKPAPENFQTYRSVGSDWLKDNFGTTDKQRVADLINSNNISMSDAGFVSMSTDVDRNIFTGRGVILHLAVSKGTNIYVTRNISESEIIGHRNMEFEFSKAQMKSGHLHIYGRVKK